MICSYSRMVKLLMTANELDVNASDNYKNTPLHIACEEGNPEIVKMLLNSGHNFFPFDKLTYIFHRQK